MLTCTQLMQLATREPIPPWNIGTLRPIFGAQPDASFSVRSVITLLEDLKIVLFLSVREVSVILEVSGLDDLALKWNNFPGLSKNTLEQLSAILGDGAAIKFISRDRRIVGISGSTNAFVQVPSLHLDDQVLNGVKDALVGTGGVATGVGLVATGVFVPNPASPWLIGSGYVAITAGSAYFTIGFCEIANGDAPVTPVGSRSDVDGQGNTISGPDKEIIGETPPGVKAADLTDAPEINVHDLPDAPPPPDVPPPIC